MLLQVGLAFIEGCALIVSPCILPVLPIILSAGLDGGKNRPYGIITGFVLAFCLFTIASRQLVLFTGLDPSVLRLTSLYLLLFFGLVMFVDKLSLLFDQLTSKVTALGEKVSQKGEDVGGFKGGVLIGSALGFVWTPCAGAILAVVLVQVIQGESSLESFLILFSFALGVSLPMLALTILGRKLLIRFQFLTNKSYLIRRSVGLIIIVTVLITGGREMIGWGNTGAPPPAGEQKTVDLPAETLLNGLQTPYPAPSIKGIGPWFNSKPLDIQELRGKVVLVDFWTYSCINCIRTLPYLTNWDQKYKKLGLVIIGIHAPEFEFEKKPASVEAAMTQHYISYAVALDNNFIAWKAFKNHYWPAHFLIDKSGKVVYVHYGEGDYDITENNIRFLLGLGKMTEQEVISKESNELTTPETYLGKFRAKNFEGQKGMDTDASQIHTYPSKIPLHHWALKGKWILTGEYIEAGEKLASLKLEFLAKHVYLVLSPGMNQEAEIIVKLNGREINSKGGRDVQGGVISINQDRLYELVSAPNLQEGELEIITLTPGVRAFAFTFGS